MTRHLLPPPPRQRRWWRRPAARPARRRAGWHAVLAEGDPGAIVGPTARTDLGAFRRLWPRHRCRRAGRHQALPAVAAEGDAGRFSVPQRGHWVLSPGSVAGTLWAATPVAAALCRRPRPPPAVASSSATGSARARRRRARARRLPRRPRLPWASSSPLRHRPAAAAAASAGAWLSSATSAWLSSGWPGGGSVGSMSWLGQLAVSNSFASSDDGCEGGSSDGESGVSRSSFCIGRFSLHPGRERRRS